MFWLLFCLTSLSCVAAVATAYCWFRVRKLLAGVSMRSFGQLSMEVHELRSLYESLLTSHRKLHARIGMREARERQKQDLDADAKEADADAEATKSTNGSDREKLRELARQRGLMR